jgi:hypothetical protein
VRRAAALAVLAVGVGSAAWTYGTTWRNLSDVRAASAGLTAEQRAHRPGDAIPLPMDRFDFYRDWTRPDDRYWLNVRPSGLSADLDVPGVVSAVARFYLLPAVEVPTIDDATVVLSWDMDPGLLHRRFTVNAREGKQVVFSSHLAGR